jgi:hypothetical protein
MFLRQSGAAPHGAGGVDQWRHQGECFVDLWILHYEDMTTPTDALN